VTGFDNIEHASLTDVGVRRPHNQDSHAVLLARDEKQWRNRGHVFLVADGMGAHAVGELASELAVGIIPHTFGKHVNQGPGSALRKAFVEANASIHARGQQNREFEGMGTTTTALLIRPEGAWVGHVGDSRAYRIRDSQIEQLSFDHSLVWEYARRQKIDPNEVEGIPSNVIIRSLGPEPLVQVDIEGPYALRDGDIFVLCSDGLSGQVSDHELGAVVASLPPAEACRFLIDLANLRGGPDNITAVVVKIGAGSKNPSDSGPPWHQRFPWPLPVLLLGTILAGFGVYLITVNNVSGGMFAFALAILVILAGVVGLVLHTRRERERAAQEVVHPPPQIYRRSSCAIERPLLDKLIKAEQALKERASEKNWDADWAAFRSHHAVAEEREKVNDFPGAFREYCRAMQIMLAVTQKQRQREEMFQPVWDKG
jgi:serine/threonine protein phosphatase PrpC